MLANLKGLAPLEPPAFITVLCAQMMEECFTLSCPVFLQALEVSDHYPVEVLLKNSAPMLLPSFFGDLSRATEEKRLKCFSLFFPSLLVLHTLK